MSKHNIQPVAILSTEQKKTCSNLVDWLTSDVQGRR